MRIGVVAKTVNGPLLEYRMRFKLSQTAAARLAEVGVWAWNAAERLRFNAVRASDVTKIASLIGAEEHDICPPELREADLRMTRVSFREVPADRLLAVQEEVAFPALTHESTELVAKVLRTLTYREREIVKLRFGIGQDTEQTYTLEEVGHILKICKDRVRQIEAKAIRKLQHPARAKVIEHLLDCTVEPTDRAELD